MRGKLLQAATLAFTLALSMATAAYAQFPSAQRRPESGPEPKNIRGVVTDTRGTPLEGARVFIRDMKTNIIRPLITNSQGLYQIFALPPEVDYEIYAEFRGQESEKRVLSGLLNRQDNVINLLVDVALVGAGGDNEASGPQLETYDLVRLQAAFRMPSGIPAPIPSVLLLHGFGEDHRVWRPLEAELLKRGFAVMSIDLRGHGASTIKNQFPIQASEDWRTSPLEFPLDVKPALDWLKTQARIDNRKIVVIGADVGANLALIASGKYPEVRTVVAIKPNLSESLAMAGSAQDFMPRSALLIGESDDALAGLRQYAGEPVRLQTFAVHGGTSEWLKNPEVIQAILTWIEQTY